MSNLSRHLYSPFCGQSASTLLVESQTWEPRFCLQTDWSLLVEFNTSKRQLERQLALAASNLVRSRLRATSSLFTLMHLEPLLCSCSPGLVIYGDSVLAHFLKGRTLPSWMSALLKLCLD